MNYIVYILYSAKADRFYTGQTNDLQNRLASHQSGISTFTSRADDWKFVYSETFDSRTMALKREIEIKNKKSKKYIQSLIDNYKP